MVFLSIRNSICSRLVNLVLTVTFVATMVITPKAQATAYAGQAGVMGLPVPGTMVNLSSAYVPLMITGLTVHPENPLLMDFIVSTGNSGLDSAQVKKQSDRLIKYFLACLTIPENNQWVNLSPYEKQRIIPQDLGQTVLGQDMLAQDYLLKQLTASLIYPEKSLGKNFWDKVYAKASQMYGTTQIPVNTFNKVWILPEYAKVYEHKDTVFVVKSHLKVMLDEDYLALEKHTPTRGHVPHEVGYVSPSRLPSNSELNVKAPEGNSQSTNALASQIVRQIILPAIEQEVNTGQNFAQLRQIYNSMILAAWFKKNLKQALLNQVYTDRSKVNGVNTDDPAIKEKIYQQYLQAYKKGVFNYIKEEVGQNGQEIPRKYFSGGLTAINPAMITQATRNEAMIALSGHGNSFKISGLAQNAAMNSEQLKRMIDGSNLIGIANLWKKRKKTAAFARENEVELENSVTALRGILSSDTLPLAPYRTVIAGILAYLPALYKDFIDLLITKIRSVRIGGDPNILVKKSCMDALAKIGTENHELRPRIKDALNSVLRESTVGLPQYALFRLTQWEEEEVDKSPNHLSEAELSLLREADEKDGFISKRAQNDERIKNQIIQIETALANAAGANQKADQVIADLKENRFKFKGEEVHILNGTSLESKVIGRVDRGIAEKYGYIHETANVVLLTPEGKVLLQLRNKDNFDDHFAMYGGHLGVGESHEAAVVEETQQETRLDSLDEQPIFVGYQSYNLPDDPNKERRSWFVKVLSQREYDEMEKKRLQDEESLGIDKNSVSREEYKRALFRVQKDRKDGSGEVVGTYEFTFDQLTQAETAVDKESPFSDKPNHFLRVSDSFNGKNETIKAFFSPDSLDSLFWQESKDLWLKIQQIAQKPSKAMTAASVIQKNYEGQYMYHAVPKSFLDQQRAGGIYTPERFEADGFIHFSFDIPTALKMANRFYSGTTEDIILLKIDAQRARTSGKVVIDDDKDAYPHLYGRLDLNAVSREITLVRGTSGQLEIAPVITPEVQVQIDAINRSGRYRAEVIEEQGHVLVKFTDRREADTSFTIMVDKGFRVISHIVKGKETLFVPDDLDILGSGMFFMIPFVNRAEGGVIVRNGRKHYLKAVPGLTIDQSSGDPMHGAARLSEWRDLKLGMDGEGVFVESSFDTADYPGLSEVVGHSKTTVKLRLQGRNLKMGFTVENLTTPVEATEQGGYEVIADVGTHPMSLFTPGKTTIQIPGVTRIVGVNKNKIPTGEMLPLGDKDLNQEQLLVGGKFDNTFEVTPDSEGRVSATMVDKARGLQIITKVWGKLFVPTDGKSTVIHFWDGGARDGKFFGATEAVTVAANGSQRQGEIGGSRPLGKDEIREGSVLMTVNDINEVTLVDKKPIREDVPRIERIKSFFQEKFGSLPSLISRGNGRFVFEDDHRDYPPSVDDPEAFNQLLSGALPQNVLIAASPSQDPDIVTIYSVDMDRTATFKISEMLELMGALENDEARAKQIYAKAKSDGDDFKFYFMGIYYGMLKGVSGKTYSPKGANFVIQGNIPIGAGTSSSAGLSVAAAQAISGIFDLGIDQDPEEWLTVAQFGESGKANKILRRVTGRLDQGTSIRGREGYLWLNNFSVRGGGELVPLEMPDTHQIVVINSKLPHDLSDALYGYRYAELKMAPVLLNAILGTQHNHVSAFTYQEMENALDRVNSFFAANNEVELRKILHLMQGIDDEKVRGYFRSGSLGHREFNSKVDVENFFKVLLKRTNHVVGGYELRTKKAIRLMKDDTISPKQRILGIMEIIRKSGQSLSMDGDFQISGYFDLTSKGKGSKVAALDELVKVAQEDFWRYQGEDTVSVLRMMGGGSGGSMVGIVRKDLYDKWKEFVTKQYLEKVGIQLTDADFTVIEKPAEGSGIVWRHPGDEDEAMRSSRVVNLRINRANEYLSLLSKVEAEKGIDQRFDVLKQHLSTELNLPKLFNRAGEVANFFMSYGKKEFESPFSQHNERDFSGFLYDSNRRIWLISAISKSNGNKFYISADYRLSDSAINTAIRLGATTTRRRFSIYSGWFTPNNFIQMFSQNNRITAYLSREDLQELAKPTEIISEREANAAMTAEEILKKFKLGGDIVGLHGIPFTLTQQAVNTSIKLGLIPELTTSLQIEEARENNPHALLAQYMKWASLVDAVRKGADVLISENLNPNNILAAREEAKRMGKAVIIISSMRIVTPVKEHIDNAIRDGANGIQLNSVDDISWKLNQHDIVDAQKQYPDIVIMVSGGVNEKNRASFGKTIKAGLGADTFEEIERIARWRVTTNEESLNSAMAASSFKKTSAVKRNIRSNTGKSVKKTDIVPGVMLRFNGKIGVIKSVGPNEVSVEWTPGYRVSGVYLNWARSHVLKLPQVATIPGGIDLASRHLKMESSGQKVNIAFDPAMIASFKRGDFSGVKMEILDVVPVDLMPLLGLN